MTGTRHNEYARRLRVPFYLVFGRPSWGLWPTWVHRLIYDAARRMSLRADRRRRDVERCTRLVFGTRHYYSADGVMCECGGHMRPDYALLDQTDYHDRLRALPEPLRSQLLRAEFPPVAPREDA